MRDAISTASKSRKQIIDQCGMKEIIGSEAKNTERLQQLNHWQ